MVIHCDRRDDSHDSMRNAFAFYTPPTATTTTASQVFIVIIMHVFAN